MEQVNMRKFLFLLFLLPYLILSKNNYVNISGKVTFNDSSKPACGASIILTNSDTTATYSANPKGAYQIDSLTPGHYSIKCKYVGYPAYKKSIHIKKKPSNRKINFQLSNGNIPLNMASSYKKYHETMKKIKSDEKLKIRIDSLGSNYKYVYLTFKNLSKHAIYLIEDLKYFSTTNLLLFSKNRKYLHPKNIQDSHDWKFDIDHLPHSKNIIKIKPHQSIRFPPVKIKIYNLSRDFKKGEYYLQVMYAFGNYKHLPGQASRDYQNKQDKLEEIKYVFSRATRVTQRSNKHLIKIK